jgi:hypothetical protein
MKAPYARNAGHAPTLRAMMHPTLPLAVVFVAALACSGSDTGGEPLGTASADIEMGTPATGYPEAVTLTTDGYIPCSGVLLAPTVVLSAGHCQGIKKTYVVTAPNAGGQMASGSVSWTPYDGHPATSSDVLLVFLDTPIHLASYPTLSGSKVAPGTGVVDVGRTLDGTIGNSDYVSPPVTIEGDGSSLGFPLNYQALPDISENGDSGGPIMLAGTHTIVAIVDTDTVEQNITEATPIDLFARVDLVKDAIEQQLAQAQAGDAGATAKGSGGGCSLAAPGR